MTKYPRGRDIAVNWTLDLGGSAVDLAACDLLFEYHTGAGSKSVPRSAYTIYNNVLSWTFHGEDQIAYGVYGLRLVATSGSEEYVFHQEGAFEIIHGEVSDEEQTLPLESSVETEQEPAEEQEEQETGTPVYVSSSPIHVEKVPLGSNITVRWRLLTTAEFDFDLAECDLYLYYAAAGSGFRAATNYELSTENGYVLTWNFAAAEQVRFGLYSLLLDVRRNGAKIATLVKDDAFSLVHRKGSIFPDRIIDFESIVTTMGGGALYTLIDVNNDGYSTVYRSDGVTPAQVDDLIIYDGNLWYAIDGSDLPYIRGLRGDLDALGNTALGLSNRIEDLEGNVGELWLTAQEFGVRMSDAEGYIGQLTLTAREFAVRMSDAEGNIGLLTLTSQQFGVRMSDAEGNIGQLTLTSQLFDVRMSDVEGNVGELMLTSEEFGVRMTNAEGSIGQLTLTAEQFAVRMSDTEGNVSLLQQTATSLTSQIQDAQGNISTLQQTATSLTSRIQNAEGSISTIAQTAESIQLQVDNQHGDIAALEVSARAITSRVSDAEGNISILEQTATSLTSQIQDAEGNISVLQQTATEISTRVTSIEGEFGEGGRVTVAESTIVQQAGLIATKVSQTEYDANNQAISTHFSTIEQTASQISTRVAAVESEFGEGGRVTVAESTIVQQAGLIATKVSQTDYDANNLAISTRFSSIEQTASEISASVTSVSSDLSTYEALTDAVLLNLQDQIDGVVETWYAEGEPTLLNYPVNTWAQADYPNHIGDLYYDKATGKAYRFMLDEEEDPAVYVWVELADEDIAKALALAGEKRRVFVSTPYAPYDVGDLWVKERTVDGQTTREIYRCKRSRAAGETIDLANDWAPADDYAVTVNYANLKILADAIVGEVSAFTYDSEGKISSASKSNITQTAEAIRLSVSNQAIGTALGDGGSINSALLDTGIDITNGDITLTANHIKLQNQSAISGLELVTIGTGANQRVVINTGSINVNGIFSTTPGSVWMTEKEGLQGYADSAAGDAYTDAVAQAATDAASYITTNVTPLITAAQSTADAAQTAAGNAQSAVNGLGYLANALLNGTTAIGGGLILSSLVGLGGNSGSGGAWELMAGMNGQYVATSDPTAPGFVAGHGIAYWSGGDMVDREDLTHYWTAEQIAAWNALTDEQKAVSNLAAKTLFRMDGSGYLANGAISWGAAGDLHLLDNVYIGPQMDQTLASISTWVTLLSTWFKDDTISINGTNYRVLRVNMASDPASTTGFQGVVWNGFFISGGDQIVISGTPGGGGGGGGATNLKELEDVYHNASGVRRYSSGNATSTDLLGYDSTKGWYAVKLGAGLQMTNGELSATGTLSSVSLAAGATNGTLHLVVNGTAQSDVAVTGLGSMAYKSSLAASDIPDLSGSYLPLSAGNSKPLTNDLYITGGNGRVVLSGVVQYNWNNTMKLLGPVSQDGELSWYDGSSWKTVYHSGNFTPGNYLPVVGATLSSTLALKKDLGYNLADFITGQHSGPFEVGRSSNTMTVAIGVTDDNYGYIQSKGYSITSEGNLVIQPDSGGLYYSKNLYPIYHSNNFRAGYEYVSISGEETITGQKTFTNQTTFKDFILKFTYSSDATLVRYLGYYDSNADLSWYDGGHWQKVYHSGNANGTDKGQWAATSLALAGGISGATHFEFSGVGSSAGNGGYIDFHYNGSSSDYTSRLIESASGTMTMIANLVMSSGKTIKIGDATISWNSNGYLHIDKPLVTAGDQIVISGTPGGGGGGGATNLWGLDDVNIPHDSSYPGNGDLLSYDLSTHKWVNVAASSVGGVTSVAGRTGAITLTTSDITDIESWISGKGYASASSLSDYLPLAGGNMNANALISWGNNDRTDWDTIGTGLMVLSSTSTASGAATRYCTGLSVKGRYGFQIASQGGDAERFDIRNTSVGTWRTLLHSGNYTDYVNATNFPGLMGNQSITLSGDVSGSGTTSITTTIGEGKVTNAMLAGSIENSKLNTIGVSKGGTGLTTWTGAYRLVYSTAATTLTTLAPNSTTTRKFLRQVGANNAATAPAWDTVTKTDVGLSDVENTALSTWAGTNKITTLGTITTGVWHGSAIGNSYLANSSITINGSSTSLGGSFSTASITAGTAGQSAESTGVSFSIPYVKMNAYGIVTDYGTHTHRISATDLTTTIGSTTYAAYHAAGYVKKDGDTMTGKLTMSARIGMGTEVIEMGSGMLGAPVTDNPTILYWYNGANWQVVLHSGNYSSYALPLAGATLSSTLALKKDLGYNLSAWTTGQHNGPFEVGRSSNAMTVAIGVTDDNYGYIQSKGFGITSDGNLVLQPAGGNLYYSLNLHPIYHAGNFRAGTEYVSISGTETITGAKTFTGQVTLQDYIIKFISGTTQRNLGYYSGKSDLSWYTGSSWNKVWHEGNSNLTSVPWKAQTLQLNAYSENESGIYFRDGFDTSTRKYNCSILVYDHNQGGPTPDGLTIAGFDGISFCTGSNTRNEVARFSQSGNLNIGYAGDYGQKLYVNGNIVSSGDQVVSSDLTLKTNLTPVTYSVADIAKARAVEFDWRDGRGHSMGSIAQDWLGVAPALVHGEEGNMSLAYGQLALVNTILLARQSESHEERIKELEARVAELEMENERLRMN